jgi:hypothetical protein
MVIQNIDMGYGISIWSSWMSILDMGYRCCHSGYRLSLGDQAHKASLIRPCLGLKATGISTGPTGHVAVHECGKIQLRTAVAILSGLAPGA